jgi:hypothetical protein
MDQLQCALGSLHAIVVLDGFVKQIMGDYLQKRVFIDTYSLVA